MAGSVDEVLVFLRDLAAKARPFALKDRQELEEFARRQLALETLEAWDIGYASEKLRQQRHAFSEQEVATFRGVIHALSKGRGRLLAKMAAKKDGE